MGNKGPITKAFNKMSRVFLALISSILRSGAHGFDEVLNEKVLF